MQTAGSPMSMPYRFSSFVAPVQRFKVLRPYVQSASSAPLTILVLDLFISLLPSTSRTYIYTPRGFIRTNQTFIFWPLVRRLYPITRVPDFLFALVLLQVHIFSYPFALGQHCIIIHTLTPLRNLYHLNAYLTISLVYTGTRT